MVIPSKKKNKKTTPIYISIYRQLLHNVTISIMKDTAYKCSHISSDEKLLYEGYWSAGEEDDFKNEVTIWIAFFANQMPFKTRVHDKGFLDHFAQLKHYINTKYLGL